MVFFSGSEIPFTRHLSKAQIYSNGNDRIIFFPAHNGTTCAKCYISRTSKLNPNIFFSGEILKFSLDSSGVVDELTMKDNDLYVNVCKVGNIYLITFVTP